MWHNIDINKNNVQNRNGSSVLFKMPNASEYKGYFFWHPEKCVRDSYTNGFVNIGYTDEWEFKLKKYGSGKYNKYEVIDEVTVGPEEIEEAFHNMNEHSCNCKMPKANKYETHRPAHLDPEAISAMDELIDE